MFNLVLKISRTDTEDFFGEFDSLRRFQIGPSINNSDSLRAFHTNDCILFLFRLFLRFKFKFLAFYIKK